MALLGKTGIIISNSTVGTGVKTTLTGTLGKSGLILASTLGIVSVSPTARVAEANPYADYSGDSDLVGNGVTTLTKDNYGNRNKETQRREIYTMERVVVPAIPIKGYSDDEEKYVSLDWLRGNHDLDQKKVKGINGEIAFVDTTAEFLDACRLHGSFSSRWIRIVGREGTEIKAVSNVIPSKARMEGLRFTGAVTVGGYMEDDWDVSVSGTAGAIRGKSVNKNSYNVRRNDWMYFPDTSFLDGGGKWRRITVPRRGKAYDMHVEGSTLGLGSNETGIFFNSDIVFENCVFESTVTVAGVLGCTFRNCTFENNGGTKLGQLIISPNHSTFGENDIKGLRVIRCSFIVGTTALPTAMITFLPLAYGSSEWLSAEDFVFADNEFISIAGDQSGDSQGVIDFPTSGSADPQNIFIGLRSIDSGGQATNKGFATIGDTGFQKAFNNITDTSNSGTTRY